MAGLDVALFRSLNRWPDGLAPWLVPFSTGHDTLLFRGAILLIVLGMTIRGGRARRAALLSLVAFPLADALCSFLKNAEPMRRPYQEIGDVISRVGLSDSMGTASSHAANLAAVATVMTLGLGLRWGAPWIVVALLVGLSRVYVGAHYPSQVLLGFAVGIACGAAVDGLARRLTPRPRPSSSPA